LAEPSGDQLLSVEEVSAAYGPFRALFGVSFAVPPGSVVALLGPNGAGKSTVARVVSGLIRPTAGQVRFQGRDLAGLPAWRIARMGVTHVPEGRAVFGSLTVMENLELAFRTLAGAGDLESLLDVCLSAFPRLAERRSQQAGTLSGGEQRMLSLARALALPPKLLVVDEISLGLAPVVVDEVYEGLSRIRDAGTTLLVVEQHIDRALAVADHAVVLSHGRVVFAGSPSEAREAASLR
jgi:branched-chain amino acid transport system ATP-binding protein